MRATAARCHRAPHSAMDRERNHGFQIRIDLTADHLLLGVARTAEPVNRLITNANEPGLTVRDAGDQTVTGGESICVHFPRPRLDVEGDELSVVIGLHQRPNVTIVDLITPPGEFSFGVTRMANKHGESSSGHRGAAGCAHLNYNQWQPPTTCWK